MTLPVGIEPTTFRLTAERSTYWAIGAMLQTLLQILLLNVAIIKAVIKNKKLAEAFRN